MKGLTLIYFAVLLETSRSSDNYGMWLSDPVCSTAGTPVCDTTCKRLGTCVDGDAGLEWVEVLNCGIYGQFCDAVSNSCGTDITSCLTNRNEFKCGSINTNFPNPYDCKTFYDCNNDNTLPTTCLGNDIGYDTCTTHCGIHLPNGVCPTADQELCKRPGEYIVVKQNTRQYYLCTFDPANGFVAIMYQCHDGFFDAVTNQCKSSPEVGCKPGGGTVVPEYCTSIGDFPDPNDCRLFYRCSVVGAPPTHYACGHSKHFNKTLLKCVYGLCSD